MPDTPTIPYASARPSRGPRDHPMLLGVIACVVALCATAFPLPSVLELLNYPPGTSMRPMKAVGMIVLSAATGLVIALPLAVLCLVYGHRQRWALIIGVVACVLALVSVFGNNWLFNHIVAVRGYVMEP